MWAYLVHIRNYWPADLQPAISMKSAMITTRTYTHTQTHTYTHTHKHTLCRYIPYAPLSELQQIQGSLKSGAMNSRMIGTYWW